MENRPGGGAHGFGGPSKYRIVVAGDLPVNWSDRLAGMAISTSVNSRGDQMLSTLEGTLLDQAQLNGVLDTLYNLHLTILMVKYLDSPDCWRHPG